MRGSAAGAGAGAQTFPERTLSTGSAFALPLPHSSYVTFSNYSSCGHRLLFKMFFVFNAKLLFILPADEGFFSVCWLLNCHKNNQMSKTDSFSFFCGAV